MWFRRKTSAALSKLHKPSEPLHRGKALDRARLPVDLVEPGMRVVKLDRPWTEVPVLFQGFTVESDSQIRILRYYCRWVLVEAEADQLIKARAKLSTLQRRVTRPLVEKRSLAAELPQAKVSFQLTQAFVDQMLASLEHADDVSLEEARPVIKECVRSISANANAMFWMAHIKNEDAYTAEHCLRVAIYAIAFARFIGLPDDDLEVVGLCGLLHDIGKLRIPYAILNKPGALTPEEIAEMQRHAEYGFQLLQSHHTLEPIVADVSRHHHERIDGNGYPHQLSECQTSRFARLVSIVDAYDAITSDRCYRAGLSASDALRILYRGRGEQFDAEMVEAFIRMMGLYPPGTLIEMTSGEVALVISSHPGKKLKPKVEILLDAHKHPRNPVVIDLANDPLNANGELYTIRQALPDGAFGVSLDGRIDQIVTTAHALEHES
ncbi:HD-GYP domain-containing protein [Marinobacter changyiensis]|uniref:HD-GYP domain-containing protein n=1 Tax=Marinobacter changyiensis TaxID=2604091 RepID=UPI001264C7D5|nr:HD-GYP domain-containing protein [Marinobacter changyiensis]